MPHTDTTHAVTLTPPGHTGGCPVRIGAHVSIAGGLQKAVGRAVDIGAACIQIFSGPPQQWAPFVHGTDETDSFRKRLTEHGIGPVVVHAKYLINLATDDSFLLANSVSAVIDDMRFAASVGAIGVVVHFGSHPAGWNGPKRSLYRTVVGQILKETPPSVSFLFENTAGGGNSIGASWTELGMIAADFPTDRIGFAIDTAHATATGAQLHDAEGVAAFVGDVGRSIGWGRVSVIHANDSKVAPGSRRDRHENIGDGYIGIPGFTELVRRPEVWPIPFILETPGTDRSGPDRANIERLRRCAVAV